jgi:hypothetical protein
MKRVYVTTTITQTREFLRDGFTDLHAFVGSAGVWVGGAPLNENDGFGGDVVLALSVPEEVFERYEWSETDPADPYRETWVRTGRALIPAEVLNGFGRPEIYDHDYAGGTRRQLVRNARTWEEAGANEKAAELRAAVAFFDEIGWLTPLRVREEPTE